MNRKLFRNDSNVIELVPTVNILKSTKSTLGTDSSFLTFGHVPSKYKNISTRMVSI